MTDREAIGPYRIVRVLGKGGMGVVLEAIREDIDRRAAIKVLHTELASNAEYAQRFLNEARAVNSIKHPGIVEIYDHGALEDGTTYLIMEFIEGETLTRRMEASGGAMPVDEVSWIGREVSLAVAAAHKRGIIHRDLKPDNIMIAADAHSPRGERVKLLDFGIAKLKLGHGHAKAETAVGTVMGTLWYMSPEQMKNTAEVDERADVYSLGALLYHLLSGQPPFRASSEAEQIALHLMQTPAPVQALVPHVPEPLGQLIDRMLLKDPALRPCMTEVATQLGATASGALPRPANSSPATSDPSSNEGPRSNSGLRGPSSLSPMASGKQSVIAPSSHSTMSGAASEVERPQRQSYRRRLAMIGGAALLPALGLILWATEKRLKPPLPDVQTATQTTALVTVAVPPLAANVPLAPLSVPPPPVAPTQEPSELTVAPKPTASRPAPKNTGGGSLHPASDPTTHRPPNVCQRVNVSQRCIFDPKGVLSLAQKKAIIDAAQSIALSLCGGKSVRLLREGTRIVFEPRVISEGNAQVFSGTLRGALLKSQQPMPAEVRLKCVH